MIIKEYNDNKYNVSLSIDEKEIIEWAIEDYLTEGGMSWLEDYPDFISIDNIRMHLKKDMLKLNIETWGFITIALSSLQAKQLKMPKGFINSCGRVAIKKVTRDFRDIVTYDLQ